MKHRPSYTGTSPSSARRTRLHRRPVGRTQRASRVASLLAKVVAR